MTSYPFAAAIRFESDTEARYYAIFVGNSSNEANGTQGIKLVPSGLFQNKACAIEDKNQPARQLRRARFKADGNIYERFDYLLEYDLANAANENKGQQAPTQDNLIDSAFPCKVWIQMRDVPLFGRLRIGNQVSPIGMTNNTYQGFLPFMERADNMDGFYGALYRRFQSWRFSDQLDRIGTYRLEIWALSSA